MIHASEIGSGKGIWFGFLTADCVCLALYGLAVLGNHASGALSHWDSLLAGTPLGSFLTLALSIAAVSSVGAYLWLHFSRSGPHPRHLWWLLVWPAVWSLELLLLHRYYVVS